MPQTLLEMTKELVLAQIQIKQVAPEALNGVLHSTYETLRHLQSSESAGGNGNSEGAAESLHTTAPVDWKSSIARHSIRCLECGETFKQLSLRHLRVHDLDPRSYRTKYNIPRSQSLSARDVTARRRELAQQIRPWELAPSKQAATTPKAATKAKAKTGAAKSTAPRSSAKKGAAKA
jgi:predicted transcriptional regulator